MQVDLDLTIQVVDDTIVIQDNTLYDTGSIPPRSEVRVVYTLDYLKYNEDPQEKTVPTYGEYSATELTIINLADGHYKLTAKAIHGEDETVETEEVFILDAFPECVADKKKDYEECGGDLRDNTLLYLKVDAVNSSLDTLVADEEYKNAQCLLQRGQNLCKDEDCKEC